MTETLAATERTFFPFVALDAAVTLRQAMRTLAAQGVCNLRIAHRARIAWLSPEALLALAAQATDLDQPLSAFDLPLCEPGGRGVAAERAHEAEDAGAAARRPWPGPGLLRTMLDTVPDLIFFKDSDGRYLACNRAFEAFVGRPSEEIIGEDDHELFGPESAAAMLAHDRQILDSGEAGRNEAWFSYPDGRRVLLDTLKIPVTGAAPALTGLIGISRNTTAHFRVRRRQQVTNAVLKSTLESTADGIVVLDGSGLIRVFNRQFLTMWQLSDTQLRRMSGSQLTAHVASKLSSRGLFYRYLEALEAEPGQRAECTLNSSDGRIYELYSQPQLMDDAPVGRVFSFRDVTVREQAQRRVRQEHAVLQSMIDGVASPLSLINASGDTQLMNKAAKRMCESSEAFRSRLGCYHNRSSDCIGCGQREGCSLDRLLGSTRTVKSIHRYQVDNETRTFEIVATPLKDEEGHVIGIAESAHDLTEHLALLEELRDRERKLEYQAYHDALTHLPNRELLRDRLEHAIQKSRRNGHLLGVLFIDLDHFKEINDSLGHEVGDQVLQISAERFRAQLRAEDTLARLGGDEFTVVLEDLNHAEEAARIARKLIMAAREPIVVQGHRLFVDASVGISFYPHDGTEVLALLRNADAAMYRAKREGRGMYHFYTADLTHSAYERLLLESELRLAIERQDFCLYYQPQFSLDRGEIVGLEALLRWPHPEWGMVAPDRFIPVAEQTGLIMALGEWVLREACRQARQWCDSGLLLKARVAVNLADKQFRDPDLLDTIMAILQQTGCAPEMLELEITEGCVMRNVEDSIERLERLRCLGVELSIDDFGTGYSSLAYLKQLPITKLKIDKSFIEDIPSDQNDEAIARAVIALAKTMQLKVIAEGVEHTPQLDFLRTEGCDEMQGYLMGRPVSAIELEAMLREHHACRPADKARRIGVVSPVA